MKKSLRTILVLTVATTAMSTIPGYSADELTGEPKKTAMKTVPVVDSKGCGCSAWLSRIFNRQNAQRALEVVDELAGVAQVGLTVAGEATGKKELIDIGTGIGTGDKVLHKVTDDLIQPGGSSATGFLKAINDGASGALDITKQVAPSSLKPVSNVVGIIHASDDAASTLLGPDGKPTTQSVLSAGGKIAGIVAVQTGDHGAVIAESVLDGMGHALQAQQGVTDAVNTASPLLVAPPPSPASTNSAVV